MIDVNSVTYFFISPKPVDMRKGRDKLAAVIREQLVKDPRNGTQAFIFYSKDYKTVKIYRRDIPEEPDLAENKGNCPIRSFG